MGLKDFEIKFNQTGNSFELFLSTDVFEPHQVRKQLFNEVQMMAVDTVYIIQNESLLRDEEIAERICHLPLFCSDDLWSSILPQSECHQGNEYQFCSRCSIEIEIHIENKRAFPRNVLSSDLNFSSILNPGDEREEEEILLCRLPAHSSLHLTTYVIKAPGRKHACWQPFTISSLKEDQPFFGQTLYFEYLPVISQQNMASQVEKILLSMKEEIETN